MAATRPEHVMHSHLYAYSVPFRCARAERATIYSLYIFASCASFARSHHAPHTHTSPVLCRRYHVPLRLTAHAACRITARWQA